MTYVCKLPAENLGKQEGIHIGSAVNILDIACGNMHAVLVNLVLLVFRERVSKPLKYSLVRVITPFS